MKRKQDRNLSSAIIKGGLEFFYGPSISRAMDGYTIITGGIIGIVLCFALWRVKTYVIERVFDDYGRVTGVIFNDLLYDFILFGVVGILAASIISSRYLDNTGDSDEVLDQNKELPSDTKRHYPYDY